MELIKKLWKDEDGQGLVEYALIIAIISLIIVVAGGPVATALSTLFGKVAAKLAPPAGS